MSETRALAFITGGTSGIGAGIARALSAQFDLALSFEKNSDSAKQTLKELFEISPHGRFRTYQHPLTDLDQAQSFLDQITKDFSTEPSVFIHCAGRIHDEPFVSSDFNQQIELIHQHLMVGMALAKVCLRSMYRESHGRMIFISSLSAHQHRRGQAAYAAAKCGIEGFSRTLALEVAHRGITVNCIAPGLIETPMTATIVQNLKNQEIPIREKIPAGFIGQPSDVGSLVKFLCTEDARYITGAVIPVDGGQSIGDVRT